VQVSALKRIRHTMNLRDTRRESHRLAGLAIRKVIRDPATGAELEELDRERLLDSLREMAERHEHFSVKGERTKW
jgi:hypothetical protein